jgi:hypothetical protein
MRPMRLALSALGLCLSLAPLASAGDVEVRVAVSHMCEGPVDVACCLMGDDVGPFEFCFVWCTVYVENVGCVTVEPPSPPSPSDLCDTVPWLCDP